MIGVNHELMRKVNEQFNEAQKKSLEKFVKQISEENNVREEVALYLIKKQYNLKYDLEIANANGEPRVVVFFEPKSVEEMLKSSEDKTEWEKRVHRQLLEETGKEIDQ